MAACNICIKKVLSHALHLKCTNCDQLVHLKCLPFVTKFDSLYTDREKNAWYCKNCIQSILPFNHYDDNNDYIAALSEQWNANTSLPFDLLHAQNKLFLPFDLNENDKIPLHDIDPDIQYYQTSCNSALSSCNYNIEDTFNENISRLAIDENSFSIFHTNIRSIPKNLNNLENYLSMLNFGFSIVGVSESWLKDTNSSLFGLEGYQCEHECRPFKTGGGVSIFIRENIEYIKRSDLSINNTNIESLFIELNKESISKDKMLL